MAPRSMETSGAGITLQEPVSLEVLQEVLMEAVDRSCEPEDWDWDHWTYLPDSEVTA